MSEPFGPAEQYVALKRLEREPVFLLLQAKFEAAVDELRETALSIKTPSEDTAGLKRAIHEAQELSPQRLVRAALTNLNNQVKG